ncbi:hypothetical protein DPMN_045804 [Dreissena polymorpha]|uniref:Uncharacterized protein n=1 Tax=Dreissena polymorpha TaxID=45954 RepID=A0A9D4D5K7_DREPO|nr:hypothetical protein DPMN_045804 [Dreissena polymorpha]
MENVKEWTSIPIDKLLIADHETTKAGLVWTRHQTRLTVQDCVTLEGCRLLGHQKKS